jgi:tetratricopeptide (TPR) repeat protein
VATHDRTDTDPRTLIPRVDLYLDAYDEALANLSRQAAARPAYADLHHRLGLLHYLGGDAARAIAAHERALALNPRYTAAHSALGYALLLSGEEELALRYWRTAQAKIPAAGRRAEHAGLALDVALAHMRRGDLPAAQRQLATLTVSGRHQHLVVREQMFLLALAGRRKDAGRLKERLSATSPLLAAHLTRSGITGGRGLGRRAVQALVARREPNHNLGEIYPYLALTWAAWGEWERAIGALAEGFALDLDLPTFHLERGRIARLRGRDDQAAAEFEAAVSADASHVQARIELGHELTSLGLLGEARDQFSAAATLEPGYADVHYQLGLAHAALDELGPAVRSFEQALAINPGFALARASLALLCARSGQDRAALDHYTQAIANGLQSADLYLSVGLLHIRLNEVGPGIQALERGRELNPSYAPIHYHLGRVYQQQGHKDQAFEAWRRFFRTADETHLAEQIELYRRDMGREAELQTKGRRFAPLDHESEDAA